MSGERLTDEQVAEAIETAAHDVYNYEGTHHALAAAALLQVSADLSEAKEREAKADCGASSPEPCRISPPCLVCFSLLLQAKLCALQDAAREAAHQLDHAIRSVRAYRTKPGGMGANILTEDRARFTPIRGEAALSSLRSLLEGKTPRSWCAGCAPGEIHPLEQCPSLREPRP